MTVADRRFQEGDAGFSVFELMTVLLVLAAAGALVVPRVFAAHSAMQLDVVAHRIGVTLAKAREQSLRMSEPRDVVLDIARRRYWSPGERTITLVDPRVTISTEGLSREHGEGRAVVRFQPDGTASGGGLSLRQGRNAFLITVDWLTGEIRVGRER